MNLTPFRPPLVLFVIAVVAAILAAIFVFLGPAPPYFKKKISPISPDNALPAWKIVAFDDLPGWRQDDVEAAFGAYLRSCATIMSREPTEPANTFEYLGDGSQSQTLSGLVADWQEPCRGAARLNRESFSNLNSWRGAVRGFFEAHFQPVQILQYDGAKNRRSGIRTVEKADEYGVYTGYFEPAYSAARMPDEDHSAPVYLRPSDLVEVNLGDFRPELSGQRIAGRIEAGRLVPYADRSEINQGALEEATEPVAWMTPDDLFFLQIQGSGQLQFGADQTTIKVGYAGQNGHPYTAIGRVMVERGILPLEEVTMQSIRDWLASADREAAQELREQNQSYVFFRELDAAPDGLGPLGAQGVPLTPRRSLAVDRRYHLLGAPVWVDIEESERATGRSIRQLMIAQDTGGAIRGPVRGDIYWGSGQEAGDIAGAMNAKGKLFVLLPRSLSADLAEGRKH